jgi:hypothetical protein
MRIPVFVSSPTALSRKQQSSRKRVVDELERLQLEARALGTSDYPSDCPLREVYVIAKHCSGGIILGFEQFRATHGTSKPGTRKQLHVRPPGKPVSFPTPWNHLEAGILFGMQLPLLIFREESIRGGVFDDGVTDVFIHEMPPAHLPKTQLEAFREVLLKWSARVRAHYYGNP